MVDVTEISRFFFDELIKSRLVRMERMDSEMADLGFLSTTSRDTSIFLVVGRDDAQHRCLGVTLQLPHVCDGVVHEVPHRNQAQAQKQAPASPTAYTISLLGEIGAAGGDAGERIWKSAVVPAFCNVESTFLVYQRSGSSYCTGPEGVSGAIGWVAFSGTLCSWVFSLARYWSSFSSCWRTSFWSCAAAALWCVV